jgi:hypothetical protein
MDEQKPNEPNDVIKFIAATVEALRDRMATRSDLQSLRDEMAGMRDRMATKDDLHSLRDEMAGMRDQMATKSDLQSLRNQMAGMRDQMATKAAMEAGFTAIRGDIERVAFRLDQVDRNQSLRLTGLGNEVSRIRSVVYLLVKDQPDLVRMLGE